MIQKLMLAVVKWIARRFSPQTRRQYFEYLLRESGGVYLVQTFKPFRTLKEMADRRASFSWEGRMYYKDHDDEWWLLEKIPQDKIPWKSGE